MLITQKLADKLKTNTLYNSIKLHSVDGDFTDIVEKNIVLNSFELEQEIMGNELKFGGCVAAQMSIKLINYNCSTLIGKRVQVKIVTTYLNDELYPSNTLFPSPNVKIPAITSTVETPIFFGCFESAEKDKKIRNITTMTAYDPLYKASKTDCSIWFAGNDSGFGFAHWQKDSNFSVLHKSLCEKLKDCGVEITSASAKVLIDDVKMNFDDTFVSNIIKPGITLVDLLNAFCELTLSVGRVSALGNFLFDTLYDKSLKDTITSYKDLSFEEYTLAPIEMVTSQYADKKVGAYGSSYKSSCYNSENILMRCRNTVYDILGLYNNDNFFGNVYQYRPTSVKLFSYWWLEIGDKFSVITPYSDVSMITSFVFNKKIKGFETTLQSKGERILGKETIKNE